MPANRQEQPVATAQLAGVQECLAPGLPLLALSAPGDNDRRALRLELERISRTGLSNPGGMR